jgi:hypothetical protein
VLYRLDFLYKNIKRSRLVALAASKPRAVHGIDFTSKKFQKVKQKSPICLVLHRVNRQRHRPILFQRTRKLVAIHGFAF